MKNKRKSGFTLVELIVVIAILGILAAIAIPRFQQYILEAQVRKEIANAKTIYTAAVAYDEKNGTVGEGVNLYDMMSNQSLIAPYLGDDVEVLPMSFGIKQGQYSIYKIRMSGYDGPMSYFVFYLDPRVTTEEDPYKQTALQDGVPVVYGEMASVQGEGVTFITVEDYLAKKAEENKK